MSGKKIIQGLREHLEEIKREPTLGDILAIALKTEERKLKPRYRVRVQAPPANLYRSKHSNPTYSWWRINSQNLLVGAYFPDQADRVRCTCIMSIERIKP